MISTPRKVGLAIGAVCVIAGGLVAAVTGPLALTKGSWLAAYLVLVAGVAQVVLADQHRLLQVEASSRAEWTTVALWVGGNAAVIGGTLLRQPLLVDLGGIALALALLYAVLGTRRTRAAALGWALRLVYVVVLVSIPIGLVLAHQRA